MDNIREGLKQAMTDAAKGRDQVRLDTVRMVVSAIRYKEIEKKGLLENDELLRLILSLCKQRRESIEQFLKGGRQDLVDKETREIQILESFLPKQLSPTEVETLVKRVIGELGAVGPKDMGRVMKVVVSQVAGQADGKVVSEIVKKMLGS